MKLTGLVGPCSRSNSLSDGSGIGELFDHLFIRNGHALLYLLPPFIYSIAYPTQEQVINLNVVSKSVGSIVHHIAELNNK